jgi:hypothetical protein
VYVARCVLTAFTTNKTRTQAPPEVSWRVGDEV